MTEQWMSFGPELRRLRVAADLSLTRLAGLLYYSKGHVSTVETGLKRPTPELAQRCDTLLGAAEGALAALFPARFSGSGAGEARTRRTTDVSEVWAMSVAPDGTSWFRLVDRRQVLVAGAASVLGFGFSDRDVSAAARQAASLEGFRALFDQSRQLGQTASPAVVLPALIAQTQTMKGIAAQSAGEVEHACEITESLLGGVGLVGSLRSTSGAATACMTKPTGSAGRSWRRSSTACGSFPSRLVL